MQLLWPASGSLLLPRPQLLQVLLQDLLGASARHRPLQPPQAADAQLPAFARKRQRHRRRRQRRRRPQQELFVFAGLHLSRPRLRRRSFEFNLSIGAKNDESNFFLLIILTFFRQLLSL